MKKHIKVVPSKDNPGKRLKKLRTVTVKDAAVLNRNKVMLYTDCGVINIAPDLEKIFHFKGIKNTELRRNDVYQRLKRRRIEIFPANRKVANLGSFVY